ncbi:MAG: efflux RND transporter permease subunit, partial [Pseudomonadota bacterium]
MNKLIAWFADNPVGANLLMFAILLGGTFAYFFQVDRQFFPSVASSSVGVTVNYLGAGPAEVEERILIRVEEAIQDLEGIKEITSTAQEGFGQVVAEVQNGYDIRVLLDDVKARVDGINTFPTEAERPIVAEFANAREQREMMLAVYGDLDEATLKKWAERIRDDIAAKDNIDKAELQAVRDFEVAIEVPEESLRRYGLSLADVQRAVASNSLNLPAGNIKSSMGDITLRTKGQAYNKADFEEIVVVQQPDGTVIKIKDIGTVIDGFVERDLRARLNGQRAILVNVLSVSEPDVTRTARIVRDYLDDFAPNIPEGLNVTVLDDASLTFKDRISMLLGNGLSGLLLVFVVLLLFLRPAVAIWTAVGIGIAFFGAIWSMAWLGISLNMISLFAFLLVLGIVVDDAIIVGEAIHARHERGMTGLEAAIRGASRVSSPVFLAVLSTLIFFAPMLAVPGNWRDTAMNIPLVVFGALTFSLIESLLILPAHLKDMKPLPAQPGRLMQIQQRFADGMRHFIETRYRPLISLALKWRTVTVTGFVLFFMICLSLVAGGWIRLSFFPQVVADFVAVTIELPENAAFERSARIQERLEAAAIKANDSMEQEGYTPLSMVMSFAFDNSVEAFAFPSLEGVEGVDAAEFSRRWRENLGEIPAAQDITYATSIGPDGKDIDIQVSSNNTQEIEKAVAAIKQELRSYGGIYDVKDSMSDPQPEIVLNLRPQAESLNLGLSDLAQQVRAGFFGAEAQRIPRGKDDVRVMVRYPRKTRESVESLSETRIRVGDGIEIPFDAVAEAEFGVGAVRIEREDRKRVAHITAEALDSTDYAQVVRQIFEENKEKWAKQFPTATIKKAGDAEEQGEFVLSLATNLVVAVFVIYAILAVSFRSYGVPFIILTAIPFGFSGAVVGHGFMGMNLSMFSILGIVAAAGVVVNDNLVLLDHLGRLRKEG